MVSLLSPATEPNRLWRKRFSGTRTRHSPRSLCPHMESDCARRAAPPCRTDPFLHASAFFTSDRAAVAPAPEASCPHTRHLRRVQSSLSRRHAAPLPPCKPAAYPAPVFRDFLRTAAAHVQLDLST